MPRAHLINPADYADNSVSLREKDLIFRRAWHLAALRRDVAQEQDYFRRTIGGTDLVIHHCGARIVAYANVCPHRFSAFFNQPKGNSPIRCPYHLWSFNADGVATGVPHRQKDSLACYQSSDLHLETWQTDTVGEFVFVSAEPACGLAEFLGPLWPVLEQLSRAAGAERKVVTQDIAADWKVVMQNTVEFEHVFSVHEHTFAAHIQKPLKLDSDPEAENSISYIARMNANRYALARDCRVDSIHRRALVPYPDGYRHHLIFPSTSIGYTDNQQLAVMDYQPIGAGKCQLTARLFDFDIPGVTAAEEAMLSIVRPWQISFTERLFDEDRSICEAVQKGLTSRPHRMKGVFLPGEQLVRRFQQIYRRWMDSPLEKP